MPRRGLSATEGMVLHVLNRGVRRLRLFESTSDYMAFLTVLSEARERFGMRILAYCVMPNHYHLVLWPTRNKQLSEFMWWFQGTHGKRWHGFRGTHGQGAVYQGRFHAFPVQNDHHFFVICRYVEANALRAGLVARAQDWPWCSLFERTHQSGRVVLDDWPLERPSEWLTVVNEHALKTDLNDIRSCVRRGTPYGSDAWADNVAEPLGIRSALRGRGRPRRK